MLYSNVYDGGVNRPLCLLSISLTQASIEEIGSNYVSLFSSHSEDYHSDENTEQHAAANERPRKQRTPKLGRKVFGSHEVKRGNGVRRQRRNENRKQTVMICSIKSLATVLG